MVAPREGAWIEIRPSRRREAPILSHPARERGLKYDTAEGTHWTYRSHPARGAWIEIGLAPGASSPGLRRTPRGVRGLKSNGEVVGRAARRRTPRGVRGLKFNAVDELRDRHIGRTPRRVRGLKFWLSGFAFGRPRSHPARGAWIEIGQGPKNVSAIRSHPARNAWIEIPGPAS